MRRACVFVLLLWSCDPQADSDYPGEPLVTLTGQVKSNGPLPPLEAAMLWQRGDPPSMDHQDLATRAPVQATFPATFTVHLYHPPPPAALRSLAPGEPFFARANAAAIPQGIAAAQIAGGALPAAGPPGNSYGIDAAHWIIHLASDARERSITAWWLGAPMNAGFHLVRVSAIDPACMTAGQLQACTADLVQRGLTEDKAHAFCVAPYRLSPAPPTEQLLLDLGAVGLGPASGCP
jgi:hypothetical protein